MRLLILSKMKGFYAGVVSSTVVQVLSESTISMAGYQAKNISKKVIFSGRDYVKYYSSYPQQMEAIIE